MFRIDVATAAATLPAIVTTPGPVPNGFWTNGVAGVSEGTVFDRDWFNTLQESLIAVLTAGGVAPARGNTGLFLEALQALFSPVTTIYSSSGSLSNGQTVWPGGLTRKWGYVITAGSETDTVIFGLPFPNNILDCGVMSINSTTSMNGASVTASSRLSIEVALNAAYSFMWWAWGN